MKSSILLLILITVSYNLAISQNEIIHEVRYKNKPIVEMTLNGKKVWVLLDTGSAITILDLNSQEEYAFNTFTISEPEFQVPGFGSENNQLQHVRKANLKFGETRLKRQLFAFDIANIASSIEARTGKKITIILGTNMMHSYGFVIDIGNNTVYMRSK